MSTATADPTLLEDQIAELRRAVLAINEELERRDTEAMELESMVEFLQERAQTLLYVLGWLIQRTVGTSHDRFDGKSMLAHLYPEEGPYGVRGAPFARWRRPARRWKQFGSRAELVEMAKDAGVKIRSNDSREWIIRALWRAGALPGGIGPHTR